MGIIDFGMLPNLDIFGIFTCHFVCTTWGLLHKYMTADLLYNQTFLIVLIWCIKETQTEIPLILAIRINIICIIFDIWIIFYSINGSIVVVALIGKILNLILRFITIPLLSKLCSDKTGGINDGLPGPLGPIFGVDQGIVARDPYENIDNLPHQSYPKSEPVIGPTGSYLFPNNGPTYQVQA